MLRRVLSLLSLCLGLSLLAVAESASYATPDSALDALVAECLETEGVNQLEGTNTLCYNSAIYPEQFIKLNSLPPADRIIITSPGGNVATARGMSSILDRRAEPVIIAGPCMSACAMVILPSLDSVYIHRTAHIAVHGITFMDYRTWFGWLKDDEQPGSFDLIRAQLGYDFGFVMHYSGQEHIEEHYARQDMDLEFIKSIDAEMTETALAQSCRVPPKDYWGLLTPDHIRTYLGERLVGMEAFAASWDDPLNQYYQDVIEPLGPRTYVFSRDFEDAVC